ncbi:MAG: DUF4856 domain-containing protein [Crocinitomicaceae bacterium]
MKRSLILILGLTLIISSCKKKGCTDPDALNYSSEAKKDDGSCTYYQVPSTYMFTDANGNNTVDYSGQTERLNQATELIDYVATGKTTAISAQVMKDMFHNVGGNGNGNFTFTSSKTLSDKYFAADTSEILAWFDSTESASQFYATTASNGQAGTLTSGTSTYLFDANGFQCKEVIEKALMGAVFMYQATQIYFGDDKMNVDNTTAVDEVNGEYYTAMEHHWDEAFGYFGVPATFPSNQEEAIFWGEYCVKRNAELGCNSLMMQYFLIGRTAITNNDISTRDIQIKEIRLMWERICAASAVAYLDIALDNIADDAKRMHTLTEAYGFINCLKYMSLDTRLISYPEIEEALNKLGDNFWTITAQDITNAKQDLTAIYGF